MKLKKIEEQEVAVPENNQVAADTETTQTEPAQETAASSTTQPQAAYQPVTPKAALSSAAQTAKAAIVDLNSTRNSLQPEKVPGNKDTWLHLAKTLAAFERELATLNTLLDKLG